MSMMVIDCYRTSTPLSYEDQVNALNPIAWWPLQDTTSTADELIGGYVGAYSGTYTLNDTQLRQGASAATKFTSGCMATTGTAPPPFDSTATWTIESWFKPTDISSLGSVEAFIYASINNANLGYMNITQGLAKVAANDYRAQMHFTEAAGHSSRSVNDPSTIVVDTIYHLITTYDAAANPKFVAYVNGVQVATANPTVTAADSLNEVRIGGHASYSGSYKFVGIISDVILYNTALSAATVLSLYNAGHL